MSAPLGNEFWKCRSKHGPNPIFPVGDEGAQQLREACEEYFALTNERGLRTKDLVKPRPFSIAGLCLHIGIVEQTWRGWRDEREKDLGAVISWAETVIEEQQFSNAVVGNYSANIIARKLGLADKKEVAATVRPHEDWIRELSESEED